MTARHVVPALLLMTVASVLAAQQGKLVNEVEPNDDFDHAQVVLLGDTLSGTRTYQNDDFYAFDVPAGMKAELSAPMHQFCVSIWFYRPDRSIISARDCHTESNPSQPYDTVYTTLTTPGRYYVRVSHAGDIETPGDEGRVYPYKLRLGRYEAPKPGLGNPMTRVTSDVNQVLGMVAAPNGDMMIADEKVVNGSGQHRILRMTPDGHVTQFASEASPWGEMAIDAFGDLLMPAEGGGVYRYNLTTGARTDFITGTTQFLGITIGAEGDVWLSSNGPPGSYNGTLWRYDAMGTLKGQIALSGSVRAFWLTTAQNGEIYFSDFDLGDVYRLAANTTQVRVISTPPYSPANDRHYGAGLVLDQDGWLYLYQPRQGKLLAFNAQYQLSQDPLAQVLDSLGWKPYMHIVGVSPAWMRDKNGKMTSRMLVARSNANDNVGGDTHEILELNQRGMGARGADPLLHPKHKNLRNAAVSVAYADTLTLDGEGSATWTFQSGQLPDGVSLANNGVLSGTPSRKATYDFLVKAVSGARAGFGRFSITVGDSPPVQVTVEAISDALMGGTALPAATVQYLDNLGNKNGRLDVGDFRAYLRSQGQLAGAPKP